MRFLLPVLPDTNGGLITASSDKNLATNIQPWPKSSDSHTLLPTSSNSSNIKNYLSINDSIYGYKSIVLKKTTEEGLKDIIRNGANSKATATVTYKVRKCKR